MPSIRSLLALAAALCLAPALAAALPTIPMPDEDPYATMRDWRPCPFNANSEDYYAVMGIRYDTGYTICIPVQSSWFEVKNVFVSAPREGGKLPLRQWPDPTYDHLLVPGYSGPSMHWCGPNAYMTAYDVPDNTFTCVEIGEELPAGRNPGWQPLSEIYVDGPGGTQAPYPVPAAGTSTHVCRDGYVLIGMHHDANIFLCGLLFSVDP
ncbi:hypothetical protein [Defluviimonas salinarum]|uniref:Secreted protein n=1 Tax=Defluviimonas salinarum TaxID=2992147 RepID=A0ABT3J7D3_9RHOB|nr:hypothetical protein [Defluviimonas salinarum]MCW3783324.1 hypothetical protein [Defluviimonas salinarum]